MQKGAANVRISLSELERVIEPRIVKDAVYGYVGTLRESLQAQMADVLKIVQRRNPEEISLLVSGINQKRSAGNANQIDSIISAIRGLDELLSGDHKIFEERKSFRTSSGYSENRSDGSPLNEWISAESQKVLTAIQERLFSPSTSVTVMGNNAAPMTKDKTSRGQE